MSPGENSHSKRALHAYHEAGHAVVWHLVNGLVEEVSIDSSYAGYYAHLGYQTDFDVATVFYE